MTEFWLGKDELIKAERLALLEGVKQMKFFWPVVDMSRKEFEELYGPDTKKGGGHV